MANHAFFYNSVNHDRVYNADSFSDWLRKFFTTGVFTGDLFVSSSEGMTVSVGTGYANVKGKVMLFDTATQLTLEAANGIYPRIDAIVMERNDTERDFFLKVVTGGYSGLMTPIAPVPIRTTAIHQLVLAQIYVGVGVTAITQADITDTRADSDLCGIVTGTVTEMDFTQFSAQFRAYYSAFKEGYEADFSAWSAEQKQSFIDWREVEEETYDSWSASEKQGFTDWMEAEKEEFDTWFAGLQDILDGDVAAHLAEIANEHEDRLSLLEHMLIVNDITAPIRADDEAADTLLVDDLGYAIVADWKYQHA